MKRAIGAGVMTLCVGLAAACGGGNDEAAVAEQKPELSGRGSDAPGLVTATGCLTAAGDRFVLTQLQPGTGGPSAAGQQEGAGAAGQAQPTTESYQLIGNEAELRRLVGRQVQVTGSADAPKVAEVRETTPSTAPSGAAGTSGAAEPAKPGEPQVATSTQTRLEVTQLRVEALTATGQPCEAAGQPQQQ